MIITNDDTRLSMMGILPRIFSNIVMFKSQGFFATEHCKTYTVVRQVLTHLRLVLVLHPPNSCLFHIVEPKWLGLYENLFKID